MGIPPKLQETGVIQLNDHLKWRKSSYSGQTGGDCIECAEGSQSVIHVRDSKNPNGPRLNVPATAWQNFVSAAATDDFAPVTK
ncbi:MULTISPECIES: DUF397 domain-containing protein [unclassified Streptomyces]|uniref:DUF397 domain-containing protein n=1 Tax=unclassified Streptomyces TaxID=2593676 RepID=UPI00363592F0